jgi:hypothetical protein
MRGEPYPYVLQVQARHNLIVSLIIIARVYSRVAKQGHSGLKHPYQEQSGGEDFSPPDSLVSA